MANKLTGPPAEDPEQAEALVENALNRLLTPGELVTFGVWQEHLDKHYSDTDRRIAIAVLNALAPNSQGLNFDVLLTHIGTPEVTVEILRSVLMRLEPEGFVTIDDWGSDDPVAAFRNVLLRRWWRRFPPSVAA